MTTGPRAGRPPGRPGTATGPRASRRAGRAGTTAGGLARRVGRRRRGGRARRARRARRRPAGVGRPAPAHRLPIDASTSSSPPPTASRWHVVGGDSFLEVSVDEGHEVLVPGYQGEPYLRFRADGTVERNRNSPATYLNDSRQGDVDGAGLGEQGRRAPTGSRWRPAATTPGTTTPSTGWRRARRRARGRATCPGLVGRPHRRRHPDRPCRAGWCGPSRVSPLPWAGARPLAGGAVVVAARLLARRAAVTGARPTTTPTQAPPGWSAPSPRCWRPCWPPSWAPGQFADAPPGSGRQPAGGGCPGRGPAWPGRSAVALWRRAPSVARGPRWRRPPPCWVGPRCACRAVEAGAVDRAARQRRPGRHGAGAGPGGGGRRSRSCSPRGWRAPLRLVRPEGDEDDGAGPRRPPDGRRRRGET